MDTVLVDVSIGVIRAPPLFSFGLECVFLKPFDNIFNLLLAIPVISENAFAQTGIFSFFKGIKYLKLNDRF